MIENIAHVFNRGVEKRNIFLDSHDYDRFINNLFLLNNKSGKIRTKKKDIFTDTTIKRDKLVEILKWTLLPNHYHLLLYEKSEGGILEFTKRIGNAYTKYFNAKYEGRSGYLFQNSAKSVLIDNNSQFLHIPFYIDLNPLHSKKIKFSSNNASKKNLDELAQYEWSSFKDYFGDEKRDGIVNQDLFYDLFDSNRKTYYDDLVKFLTSESVLQGVNLAG